MSLMFLLSKKHMRSLMFLMFLLSKKHMRSLMFLMFFQSLRFVKAAKPSAYYPKNTCAALMSLMFLLSKKPFYLKKKGLSGGRAWRFR